MGNKSEKYWKTESFRELWNKWNEVLDKYNDANHEKHPTNQGPCVCPQLKRHSISFKYREDNEEYYRLAGQLLYHGKWRALTYVYDIPPIKVPTLKSVWKLISEGKTLEEVHTLHNKKAKCKLTMFQIRQVKYWIEGTILKEYIETLHEEQEQESSNS